MQNPGFGCLTQNLQTARKEYLQMPHASIVQQLNDFLLCEIEHFPADFYYTGVNVINTFTVTETITKSVIANSVSRLIFEERVGQLYFLIGRKCFFMLFCAISSIRLSSLNILTFTAFSGIKSTVVIRLLRNLAIVN